VADVDKHFFKKELYFDSGEVIILNPNSPIPVFPKDNLYSFNEYGIWIDCLPYVDGKVEFCVEITEFPPDKFSFKKNIRTDKYLEITEHAELLLSISFESNNSDIFITTKGNKNASYLKVNFCNGEIYKINDDAINGRLKQFSDD